MVGLSILERQRLLTTSSYVIINSVACPWRTLLTKFQHSVSLVPNSSLLVDPCLALSYQGVDVSANASTDPDFDENENEEHEEMELEMRRKLDVSHCSLAVAARVVYIVWEFVLHDFGCCT